MAENLVDGEFWLPPQFLNDDDTPKRRNSVTSFKNEDVFDPASRTMFPCDFPYAFGSCGSSETESSDEEDPLAELTRLMTQQLDLHNFPSQKPKGSFVSGSPQSTLCAMGKNGCGCEKGSGSGSSSSPNSVCHVTSQSATWDLLHAAAGEVERMRMTKVITSDNDERFGFCCNHTGKKPTGVGFYTQQQQQDTSLSHHQLQIAQFQMLRKQQMAKQQQRQNYQTVLNRGRGNGDGFVGGRNVGGIIGFSPSAWPTLNQAKQQQYGSGMRGVFLENPSANRVSTGTGVFLPRSVDTPVELRKKPGCSRVLVPARVVQALNLKVEDMVGGQPQPHHHHHHPRFGGVSSMENASPNSRIQGNNVISQQKRSLRPQPPLPAMNLEIRLPQDWTY